MILQEKVACLEQLKHLRREVDLLSQRIAELEYAAQGGVGRITGMPRSARRWDRTGDGAARIADLSERLEARRTRCMELLGALYEFIDGIGDSLLRQIFTYRYIDGDSWQRIATRVGGMEESGPRKMHNRFLEAAELDLDALLSGNSEKPS